MADFPLEFLLQVKNDMSAGLSKATSDLKTMGTEAQSTGSKVKQSGIGIGAGIALITTNLVNTINSVIGLKRQWEDLKRSQDNVTQSGFSLANAQGKLKTATLNLQAAKKGDAGASKQEIEIAQLQFKEDMKNAKSKLDVMKAHEKLNKVMNQGGIDTDKLTKKQIAYDRALRGVKSATINQKEAQVNLKRATEDFYLQTIPTAVGVVGSFGSVLQVVQGGGGIGGVTKSIAKFSLVGVGLAGVFLAIKSNFLGFRDALTGLGKNLGDAVPALKPFLNILESVGELLGLVPPKKGQKAGAGLNKAIKDLQAQFGPLIGFFQRVIDDIMKGDWSKVFQRIVGAAQIAWKELKKAFPILGDIESLVNKIQNGNWDSAFLQIAVAAKAAWETLIQSVPFFAGVDTFIKKLQAADWKGAFDVIAKGARDALGTIFGEETITNFITQLQQIPAKLKAAMNEPGATAFSVIDAMIPTDVKNFAVWASTLVTNAITALNLAIQEKLTFISTQFIDPFIASLFKFETWTKALSGQADSILKGGKLIFDFLMNAIFPKDAQSAEAKAAAFTKNLMNFWNAIMNWLQKNMPDAKAAATAFVNNIVKTISTTFSVDNMSAVIRSMISGLSAAVGNAAKSIQQIGFRIGHQIAMGIINAIPRFFVLPGSAMDKAIKQATGEHASGFHGFVGKGVMMGDTVGERGIEKVDITPMSDIVNRRDKSNGGGTITIIVYSVLDGQVIAESVAKRISVNQAVYR